MKVRILAIGDVVGKPGRSIIVNRIGLQDASISLNKALETIGRDIYFQLPNDYVSMVESRNNGVPLLQHAPKSKLQHSFNGLVNKICGREVIATPKEKARGWFSRG